MSQRQLILIVILNRMRMMMVFLVQSSVDVQYSVVAVFFGGSYVISWAALAVVRTAVFAAVVIVVVAVVSFMNLPVVIFGFHMIITGEKEEKILIIAYIEYKKIVCTSHIMYNL